MKSEIQKYNACQKAIELKNSLEGGFLNLGEQLYEIKENSLWEGVYPSWEEFTWELRMSSNTINKLIQVHKTLVLGYGISIDQIKNAGGFSLVVDVLPMITSKKDALKWLNKAQTLTRTDLRKELHEEKTGVEMAECKHKNTYVLEVCRDCGERRELLYEKDKVLKSK